MLGVEEREESGVGEGRRIWHSDAENSRCYSYSLPIPTPATRVRTRTRAHEGTSAAKHIKRARTRPHLAACTRNDPKQRLVKHRGGKQAKRQTKGVVGTCTRVHAPNLAAAAKPGTSVYFHTTPASLCLPVDQPAVARRARNMLLSDGLVRHKTRLCHFPSRSVTLYWFCPYSLPSKHGHVG